MRRSRIFLFLLALVCSVPLFAQELLDETPPVVTPQVSGTGANGWYTSDVAIHWDVEDSESLISLRIGCVDDVVQVDVVNAVYNCTAVSLGGSSSVSVTVNRDTKAPGIEWSGNAILYQVHHTVAITCNATDSMSGVASSTCDTPITGPAYNFSSGRNTYTATAVDNAGNNGSSDATFDVVVTTDGVKTLVDRFCSKKTVAQSLKKKLDAAGAYALKGDLARKQKQINGFIDEVNRERGRTISSPNADVLIRLALLL